MPDWRQQRRSKASSGNNDYSHVAFADESNWNQGRFRSISLVSARKDHAREFHRQLNSLRAKHGKAEFKWRGTTRRHGIELIDFFFQSCDRLRVDVLIWDMEDSRHRGLRDLDDKANFARMYYHLLHNVLKRRWRGGESWLICPDEHGGFDWSTLERCLRWKCWAVEKSLLSSADETLGFREFYRIMELRPVNSREYLLVQLADLFAGLAVYSYAGFDKYTQWANDQEPSLPLFTNSRSETESLKLTSSDKRRLPILSHLERETCMRKLHISLKRTKGLYTHRPDGPLNFWMYSPQCREDKAQTKAPKSSDHKRVSLRLRGR